MERKAVLLLYEHLETMQELSDEELGGMVRALYRYELDGTEPTFADRALRMMWARLKSFADTSYKNLQAKRKARSEAGKIGNAKRWGAKDDIAKIANATDAIDANRKNRLSVSDSVSVSESVSVSVPVSVSESVPEKKSSPDGEPETAADASPAPTRKTRFQPPDSTAVTAYFAEKDGTAEQAQRFYAYYESNGWRVGRNPMKNWQAAASGWMARDRDPRHRNTFAESQWEDL